MRLAILVLRGAKEHSWPFRSHPDAQALQQHLRECLQRAIATDDRDDVRRLLTVALVGGDPAGVELGDLLPRWYAELGGDREEIRVIILERSEDILQEDITAGVRDVARESLQQREVPVQLCFNSTVMKVHPDRIEYKDGDEIETLDTETLLWTAGVCAHPLIRSLPIEKAKCDRFGRPKVLPTLQLPDYPEVFAGGDCAAEEGNILPPLAQVAYQEGGAIARNLKALCEGKELIPSEVNLRGSLLKLGLNDSAANLFGRFEVSGKIGHWVRHGTYLQLLPTPVHNLKASAEWSIDEIFERYSSPVGAGGSSEQTHP